MSGIRNRRAFSALFFAGWCAALSFGCSGNDSDDSDSTTGGSSGVGGTGGTSGTGTGGLTGDASCNTDPRVDAYVPGLTRPGDRGVLSFRLVEADPAPPARGDNTFVLEITDSSDGTPNTGDLRLDLRMPDHGHVSPTVPTVSFDAQTNQYTVTGINLFMSGVWRIQIDAFEAAIDDADVPVDTALFFFCVEG